MAALGTTSYAGIIVVLLYFIQTWRIIATIITSGSNFLKLNSARAIMLLAIAILRVSELQTFLQETLYSAYWPTSLLCPCILIIRCHTELMCIYSKFKKKQQNSIFFYLFIYGCIVLLFSPYLKYYIYILFYVIIILVTMNNRSSLLVFVCININYHLL